MFIQKSCQIMNSSDVFFNFLHQFFPWICRFATAYHEFFSWIFSVSAIAASLAASHAQHQQSNSKYSIASLTANSSVKDEFSRYHRPQQLPHQQPTVSSLFLFFFWLFFLAFLKDFWLLITYMYTYLGTIPILRKHFWTFCDPPTHSTAA